MKCDHHAALVHQRIPVVTDPDPGIISQFIYFQHFTRPSRGRVFYGAEAAGSGAAARGREHGGAWTCSGGQAVRPPLIRPAGSNPACSTIWRHPPPPSDLLMYFRRHSRRAEGPAVIQKGARPHEDRGRNQSKHKIIPYSRRSGPGAGLRSAHGSLHCKTASRSAGI